jgi:integrase
MRSRLPTEPRRSELANLTWGDVDWDAEMIYLATEEQYAKNDTAKRAVPLIRPLRKILRAERKRQRRPSSDQLVCPGRKPRKGPEAGRLSTTALYKRADKTWQEKHLVPIRLHECRHTAASWMYAAGIDLKSRSVLMGHASTASANKGYGSITNDRYTHLLPGEIQKAGKQLSKYLAAQTKKR